MSYIITEKMWCDVKQPVMIFIKRYLLQDLTLTCFSFWESFSSKFQCCNPPNLTFSCVYSVSYSFKCLNMAPL